MRWIDGPPDRPRNRGKVCFGDGARGCAVPSRPGRIGNSRPTETRPLADEPPSSDQDDSSIVAIVKLIRLKISITKPMVKMMLSGMSDRNSTR